MKRQIAVSKSDRQFLMKLFKVTERTVFNALALDKPGNDLHKRIRKAAGRIHRRDCNLRHYGACCVGCRLFAF